MTNCRESVIARGHFGNYDGRLPCALHHDEGGCEPHFLDGRGHSPHDRHCLIQDGNVPHLDAGSTFEPC